MAVYRQVHTTFWQDPFVLDTLDYKEKYFYLYLMTNSKTTQCGVYEISESVMRLETGLSLEDIKQTLKKLEQHSKIRFNDQTKEIMLLNWLKYNPVNNVNMEKCVLKELKDIKSEDFRISIIDACKAYNFKTPHIDMAYEGLIRGLHTPTKKEEEEEEEEEEKEKKEEEEEEEEKEKEEEKEEWSPLLLSNLWTNCGYGTVNSVTIEKLIADVEIYSWPWVKEAIEKGNDRGKRSYAYVKAVLRGWQTDGKEDHREPRGTNPGNTGKEERDYSTPVDASKFDDDELYKDLI